MDKTKSPRGQIIENLDDFKYWLTYMEGLASMKRPYVKHQMLELIKEASLLQIYDDDKVSDLVDKIDDIQNESIIFGLKKSFIDAEDLHKQALEFKFNCENSYGKDEAFNFVVNQFEIYILETLKPIKKMDSGEHDFKRKVTEYLEEAKKNKFTNIEDSWRCLCLINRNILDNLEYFKGKISKEQKSSAGKTLKLSGDKDAIIELIKKVDNQTMSKKTACLEAGQIVYGKGTSKKLHHNTFTIWQKQYGNSGEIKLKNN